MRTIEQVEQSIRILTKRIGKFPMPPDWVFEALERNRAELAALKGADNDRAG